MGHGITSPEAAHLRQVWQELVEATGWSSPPRKGAAVFHAKSHNRKLSPVDLVMFPGQPRPRPIPRAPFCSSTYAAIAATCPSSCPWKGAGCYADAGFTKVAGLQMDRAAGGRSALDVIREEVDAIDGAFSGGPVPKDGARGGRDLRLHVGGDAVDERGARMLARAVMRWRLRGGGLAWSFTHLWRSIPRAAFGELSVLASCDHPREVADALARGYVPALVVPRFPGPRAFPVFGTGARFIPCPAETTGGRVTCVECRLCLDDGALRARGRGIAFQLHGPQAQKAAAKLVQIRRTP